MRYMLSRTDEDHLDLDAPYQRESVWTLDQRRALIKSMIMGLPIGAVVIANLGYENEKFQRVIDGKQRIETLRAFEAGEFTVPQDWFEDDEIEHRDPHNETVWSDLSLLGRRHFEDRPFPSMEFESTYYHVRVDRLDPHKDCGGKGCGKPECDDGQVLTRYDTVNRTPEEMIQAEAEIFMLLNGGGTDQTAEHMAAVAEMAR